MLFCLCMVFMVSDCKAPSPAYSDLGDFAAEFAAVELLCAYGITPGGAVLARFTLQHGVCQPPGQKVLILRPEAEKSGRRPRIVCLGVEAGATLCARGDWTTVRAPDFKNSKQGQKSIFSVLAADDAAAARTMDRYFKLFYDYIFKTAHHQYLVYPDGRFASAVVYRF